MKQNSLRKIWCRKKVEARPSRVCVIVLQIEDYHVEGLHVSVMWYRATDEVLQFTV